LRPQRNFRGWGDARRSIVSHERKRSHAAGLKGFAPGEIIGEHFSRFYPPEAVREGKPERELQIASSIGRFEEERWRVVIVLSAHADARTAATQMAADGFLAKPVDLGRLMDTVERFCARTESPGGNPSSSTPI